MVNPSFETANPNPITNFNQGKLGSPLVVGWSVPTAGTSDYFNHDESNAMGNRVALAHSGSGRVGLIAGVAKGLKIRYALGAKKDYREYVQGTLARQLAGGTEYCVEMYVLHHQDSRFARQGLGINFSRRANIQDTQSELEGTPVMLNQQAIDYTSGWQKVTGSYIARGGETGFQIGFFGDEDVVRVSPKNKERKAVSTFRKLAYYFIDDVSVYAAPEQGCVAKDREHVQASEAEHMVLVLDISFSMKNKGYLEVIKQDLSDRINEISQGKVFSLITFSDSSSVVLNQVSASAISDDNLWDSFKAGGATNHEAGIMEAYDLIKESSYQNNQILMISDGRFTASSEVLDLVESKFLEDSSRFSILMFDDKPPGNMLTLIQKGHGNILQPSGKKEVRNALGQLIPNESAEVLYSEHSIKRNILLTSLKVSVVGILGYLIYDQLIK